MSLPKIAQPTIQCVLPSDEAPYRFRPMLYKEEKILRMARQSTEPNEQIQSLIDVLNACSLNGVKFEDRPIFDVEFAFTQLRAGSISNVVDVSYEDVEDKEVRKFQVDLHKIEVKVPDKGAKPPSVELSPNVYLKLRYPAVSLYASKIMYGDAEVAGKALVASCLDKIYDGEKVTDFKTYKQDEVFAWLDELPISIYKKIEEFLDQMPSMEYIIEYTNKLGTERKITLRTIEDFFTYG